MINFKYLWSYHNKTAMLTIKNYLLWEVGVLEGFLKLDWRVRDREREIIRLIFNIYSWWYDLGLKGATVLTIIEDQKDVNS